MDVSLFVLLGGRGRGVQLVLERDCVYIFMWELVLVRCFGMVMCIVTMKWTDCITLSAWYERHYAAFDFICLQVIRVAEMPTLTPFIHQFSRKFSSLVAWHSDAKQNSTLEMKNISKSVFKHSIYNDSETPNSSIHLTKTHQPGYCPIDRSI